MKLKLLIICILFFSSYAHAWMVINETGLNLQIEYGLRNPIKFNMLSSERSKTMQGPLDDGYIWVTGLTGVAKGQSISRQYPKNDENLMIHVMLDRNSQKIYLSQIVP